MKETKDNFSQQAAEYSRYRPTYPAALFDFLLSIVDNRDAAWDCGTGNGQVAVVLSGFFDQVQATDISARQIDLAIRRDNIVYSIQRAEETSFADHSFGLVTVAQAIHWFDFTPFYNEVKRTLKPGGVLAVIGYGLARVDPETDKIIDDFYYNVVGPYWDKERKYIEEGYQTIPFPFREIAAPELTNHYEWSLEEFTGYLGTWSAVQHYIHANNSDPVIAARERLALHWPAETTRKVSFPILLRVGTAGG
jgi:ubiquinone/menaquinone biosynthesis C-methylase UbiE